MSLIVKIMSGEDLADSDTRKAHTLLVDVKSVDFVRRGGALAVVTFNDLDEPVEYALDGNVYVMNEAGKTVSSFGCASPDLGVTEEREWERNQRWDRELRRQTQTYGEVVSDNADVTRSPEYVRSINAGRLDQRDVLP